MPETTPEMIDLSAAPARPWSTPALAALALAAAVAPTAARAEALDCAAMARLFPRQAVLQLTAEAGGPAGDRSFRDGESLVRGTKTVKQVPCASRATFQLDVVDENVVVDGSGEETASRSTERITFLLDSGAALVDRVRYDADGRALRPSESRYLSFSARSDGLAVAHAVDDRGRTTRSCGGWRSPHYACVVTATETWRTAVDGRLEIAVSDHRLERVEGASLVPVRSAAPERVVYREDRR